MKLDPYLEDLRVTALCRLAGRANVVIFPYQARARLRRGGTLRKHLRDVIENPPEQTRYLRPVIRTLQAGRLRGFGARAWTACSVSIVLFVLWLADAGGGVLLPASALLALGVALWRPTRRYRDVRGRTRSR